MSNTLASSRVGRWGIALVAASVGMLSFAAAANATVYHPANSAQFMTALNSANTTPGFDKIVIPSLTAISPPANVTISDDLMIEGDHSFQGQDAFQGPTIDGGAVPVAQRSADFITVSPNVRFLVSGIQISAGSSFGFAVIKNNGGSLRLDGDIILQNEGQPLTQPSGRSVITNTTITANTPAAINSAGSTRIYNSTIEQNQGGGVQATGTFEMRNTVLAQPAGVANCFSLPSPGSNNYSTDTSCGPSATVGANPMFQGVFFYNGPTQTNPPAAGSPLIDAGDDAHCMSTDQGFYPRPAGAHCDIGAVESGAVRDTTPPTCVVTAVRRGGTGDQQDVTLSDSGAGIGWDGVFSEETTITNGTVANPLIPAAPALPADPARPGNTVLTATKADQTQKTRWSFTARDWAGNVRACS